MGAHPVTAVEVLDLGERLVADRGLGDEQLQLRAPLGDGGEHELAGVALEHHAAGDRDLGRSLGAGREIRPLGAHLGQRVGAVEAVRVRLGAGLAELVDEALPPRPLRGQPAPTVGRTVGVGGVGGRLVHGSLTVQRGTHLLLT